MSIGNWSHKGENTGSFPSTPFFNLKEQEHLQGCTEVSRVSVVSCNPFVLKKEPNQENYQGVERGIGGTVIWQEEGVCFPCGRIFGLGGRKTEWVSSCSLTGTVSPGSLFPGGGSPPWLKKLYERQKYKTNKILWEIPLPPSSLPCSVKHKFLLQQLCPCFYKVVYFTFVF